MAKTNWETIFEGKLKVIIRDIGDFMVELVKDNLALYFSQAYAVLTAKVLYGVTIERDWKIESFSPSKRILIVKRKEIRND